MAYIITDDCINCGACIPECPVECIKEGDTKATIEKDDCVECGACAGVCPVDAAKPE
jgi:ferredoxin